MRHGADPTCSSCHEKLEPSAKLWFGNTQSLSRFPNRAKLVYTTTQGKRVEIEVTGFQEMAQVLVGQEDYASCQVRHIWNWFVGEDVPLSTTRLNELTQTFNQVQRRPKDFISYLVNQPEFFEEQTFSPEMVNFSQIRTILNRCDQCHAGVRFSYAPYYARHFPFSEDPFFHNMALQRLSSALNLHGRKDKRVMPPENSGWQPSEQELNLIRIWLSNGARDEEGQPTLTTEQTKPFMEWQNIELEPSGQRRPQFGLAFKRVVNFLQLSNIVDDLMGNKNNQMRECMRTQVSSVGGEETRILAFKVLTRGFNALSGQPFETAMDMSFLRTWSQCVDRLSDQMVDPLIQRSGELYSDYFNNLVKANVEERIEAYAFFVHHLLPAVRFSDSELRRIEQRITRSINPTEIHELDFDEEERDQLLSRAGNSTLLDLIRGVLKSERFLVY